MNPPRAGQDAIGEVREGINALSQTTDKPRNRRNFLKHF